MDPLIVLFGLAVGIMVGLTGMGGGSLMTPILILVFGFKPIVAVGTDLAYGAVTKTVGGIQHFRQKTVSLGISAWMGIGSVPAAIAGVYVLEWLERTYGHAFDKWLLVAVAGALLFTGVAVLARALFLPKLVKAERADIVLERRHKVSAVALGVFVGFVLGVTSAGSGSLIAVGLILVFRLLPQRVVGTDVAHAAILLWAAAAAHVVAGNVDYALAGTILLGSVPGVWLGSRWCMLVPVGALRLVLAYVLIGCGLALLSKAGTTVPPLAIVGVPGLLAVLTYIVYAGRARPRAPATESA